MCILRFPDLVYNIASSFTVMAARTAAAKLVNAGLRLLRALPADGASKGLLVAAGVETLNGELQPAECAFVYFFVSSIKKKFFFL